MSSTSASLLEDLENWAKSGMNFSKNYVYVRGIRLKPAMGQPSSTSDTVISFFSGKLNYSSVARVFVNDIMQLFSDRYQIDRQPFDIHKADALQLQVFVDGHVQYTLKSWNNFTSSFVPQCQRTLLQGFDK